MKAKEKTIRIIQKQDGATAIVLAVVLFLLLACGAVAVDIGNLCLRKAELQNAADAGALAGARALYDENNGTINVGCNQIGHDAAEANKSQNVSVEVNWSGGNAGDVQRGHWRFADSSFTANDSTDLVDLWDVTSEELDNNLNFINAVKVTARREAAPIASFFAKIFGFNSFQMSCDAVAYLGFAGTLQPTEADQPVAICKQALQNQSLEYTCSIGRMLNSGSDAATHNSAGWTNFSQPCETANANEMRSLICNSGNPEPVEYGDGIGATGGVQDNVFRRLRDCWLASDSSPNPIDGLPNDPWPLTLPVIDCPGNNVSNCATLVGAVEVLVVFMSPEGGTPDVNDAPYEMNFEGNPSWTFSGIDENSDGTIDGQDRWIDFVEHFNMQNVDGSPAPYAKKSIYFLPDCTYHEPAGLSGGENFGILAKIPVLVE